MFGWAVRKHYGSLGAALLLLVFLGELILSVRQQSLSWDEGDHIFAGCMSWKKADFGINPIDNRPDQLVHVLFSEGCEQLNKSIAALPASLRTIADLVIIRQRTLQEVSQVLDLSNSSVKTRLLRARRRLRRIIKARETGALTNASQGR